MIDVKKNTYELFANLPSGQTVNLTPTVQSMTWGDPVGELAASSQIKLANYSSGQSVSQMIDLCTNIQIRANGKIVFDGIVWEHEMTRSRQADLSIIAYDRMRYAANSKDTEYWTAGKSTKTIVSDICRKWGIPLDYRWGGITHPKMPVNNRAVSQMITDVIEEAERQIGKSSNIIFSDGKLIVDYQGSNQEVYVFDDQSGVMDTNRRVTLNGLVTKVIIMGKANDDGRSAVSKTLTGKTEYGILQEVVQITGDTTLNEAAKEAQEILNENGSPEEYIDVETPDVPTVRRGDKVKIVTPDLNGYFIVSGVTHNAAEYTMSLVLKRPPNSGATGAQSQSETASGNFKVGDAIILNGAVYATSYGENQGRTFADYRSTVTIVKDAGRKCPYHIGAVGWAEPSSIKKA